MERRAKIVATIGPSTQDEETLRKLIHAGLDVARLNFSHGTHEEHAARIKMIRKLSDELCKPVSILQDLQGPKLRVGVLPENGIPLLPGQEVLLANFEEFKVIKDQFSASTLIPMEVPDLSKNLEPGNRILLDDGNLEFQVISVGDHYILSKVVLGGTLLSHKGVNLPGAKLNIPGFTEKDREDLIFGLQQGVDYVAISFVRTADDVILVRKAIREIAPSRSDTPIIAKLEKPEAIDNLDAILEAADGVMVARGDLAVETSPAFVPVAQKKIIQAANRVNKIVITATQMLESMIHNPRPTRAEASDVANAILDGTDAVMLSAETASGQYPVETVVMMDAIIEEAELHFQELARSQNQPDEVTSDDAVSLTRAARELAHDRSVAAIAVFTQTGKTAILMAKCRPGVPILAFTPEISTYQRIGLFWGCIPFLVPYANTVETMLDHVDSCMVSDTPFIPGQQVVVITGFPVGTFRPPNFALLHTIGENK